MSLIGLFKYPYGSYLHVNFLGPIKIMVGKVRGNFGGAQKFSLKIWRFEPYELTKIYLNCPRIELQRVLCESNLDLNWIICSLLTNDNNCKGSISTGFDLHFYHYLMYEFNRVGNSHDLDCSLCTISILSSSQVINQVKHCMYHPHLVHMIWN